MPISTFRFDQRATMPAPSHAPRTAEAMVVHRADELDGTMGNLRTVTAAGGAAGNWSAFQSLHDRYLWIGSPLGAESGPVREGDG